MVCHAHYESLEDFKYGLHKALSVYVRITNKLQLNKATKWTVIIVQFYNKKKHKTVANVNSNDLAIFEV